MNRRTLGITIMTNPPMKIHRLCGLLIAGLILMLRAHAAIPAGAQKEIDQLVQQDKFTAALAKVDALLKDQPADKDLLDLKAQLQKSTKPVAVAEKPAVRQTGSATAQGSDSDKQTANGPSAAETITWINEKVSETSFTHYLSADGQLGGNISRTQIGLSESGTLEVSQYVYRERKFDSPWQSTWKRSIAEFGKYPTNHIFTKRFSDKVGDTINAVIIGNPSDENDMYVKWIILPCSSADNVERVVKALKHLSTLAKERKELF